jgi:hypothetical protein
LARASERPPPSVQLERRSAARHPTAAITVIRPCTAAATTNAAAAAAAAATATIAAVTAVSTAVSTAAAAVAATAAAPAVIAAAQWAWSSPVRIAVRGAIASHLTCGVITSQRARRGVVTGESARRPREV